MLINFTDLGDIIDLAQAPPGSSPRVFSGRSTRKEGMIINLWICHVSAVRPASSPWKQLSLIDCAVLVDGSLSVAWSSLLKNYQCFRHLPVGFNV